MARERLAGTTDKFHPDVVRHREAFQRLGFNPNRFPSSIEAMLSRIPKGGLLPSINPAVDIANITALCRRVPLGVHDLDRLPEEGRPGRAGGMLIRPIVTSENPANRVFVDWDGEGPGDLPRNAGTPPGMIAQLHLEDGFNEFFIGSVGSGPTPAPG